MLRAGEARGGGGSTQQSGPDGQHHGDNVWQQMRAVGQRLHDCTVSGMILPC